MEHPDSLLEWLEAELRAAEDEARRQAARDGVPAWWIEAVLAKLRGDRVGTA
jgi:hypothetical protein